VLLVSLFVAQKTNKHLNINNMQKQKQKTTPDLIHQMLNSIHQIGLRIGHPNNNRPKGGTATDMYHPSGGRKRV
jgi:hypothetical protein